MPRITRRPFSSLSVLALLVIAGCRGKVLATASLGGPGRADIAFTSTGKPVVLWADTEGEWRGGRHAKFPAHYEIDVLSNGAIVGHVSCDTKDSSTSVCGVESTVGSTHSGDCEYKLACDLPILPPRPTALHVVAMPGPDATRIGKMSLNVRAR